MSQASPSQSPSQSPFQSPSQAPLSPESKPEHPVPPEQYLYFNRTPPLAPEKPLIQRTWFMVLMLAVFVPLGMILFLRWLR